MILVNTEYIPNKEIIEVVGMVKGEIVQSKHLGRDFMAGLKTIVGGEIKGYTEMIAEARKIATDRMIKEAEKLGADAIVDGSSVGQVASQTLSNILATRYGVEMPILSPLIGLERRK